MPFLLFWSFAIAHVVVKAIWGAEEYIADKAKPALTKLGQYNDEKVKSDDWKLGWRSARGWWWGANALAWLVRKTGQHGLGVAKAAGSQVKEGHSEARAIFDWAKTERQIAKSQREAAEINNRIAWDELDDAHRKAQEENEKRARQQRKRITWEELLKAREEQARKGAQSDSPRQQTQESQPVPEVHEEPRVEPVSEVLPGPVAGALPGPAPVLELEPGQVIPVPQIAPRPVAPAAPPPYEVEVLPPLRAVSEAPADTQTSRPIEIAIGEIIMADANGGVAVQVKADVPETTTGTQLVAKPVHKPAVSSSAGIQGARDAFTRLAEITANISNHLTVYASAAQELGTLVGEAATDAGKLVDGLKAYNLDSATLEESQEIVTQLTLCERLIKSAANKAHSANSAASSASAATETASTNMDARHGGVAQAIDQAPVERVASIDFYNPQKAS